MHRTLWVVVVLLCALAGCSRQHFRARADRDVEGVISQKNVDPAARVQNWHAYADPRARFAEPPANCPDFPPHPPDDYYAWVTSPNPQRPGKGGVGRYEGSAYLQQIAAWDAHNRAEDAANAPPPPPLAPAPAAANPTGGDPAKPGADPKKPADAELGATTTGSVAGGAAAGYLATFATQQPAFRIRFDQSVELAIFNSREFQDRREDLYLAALPVTLERYSFAAQAFAAEQVVRDSLGRDFPGSRGSEQWRINTDIGFTRQFATGGELLVRLANQVVVDLSGPNPTVSFSNLALTFTQPFLRGGGYAVTLEALTQAERTLLYAVRSYARFRRVFYVALAAATDYTNNPYGLQGLSTNLGRGVGANLTARSVGYLPTILRAATLANERKNVAALEQFLLLFENLKEGGAVNELQVTRVEQNLLRSRSSVLINTRLYLDNVDFFKLQLGVPATLPLELDDTPLRPIRTQLQNFEAVYDQLRALETEAGRFAPGEPAAALRGRWTRLLTESPLARGTPFARDFARRAEELRRQLDPALAQQVAALGELRRKLLDARADRQLKAQPETPATIAELEGIDAAIDRIRLEQALRRYEVQPWLRVPADRRAAEQALAFRAVFDAGTVVAVQPRNDRLGKIRTTFPELPSVTVDGADLMKISFDDANQVVARAALMNRLDLLNARAQVVDSWRQINVAANALQGTFDVRYDLNAATPRNGQNGLAFGQTRTQNTVTIRAEPPFVRRAERNNYRAALISHQRSRRNLMSFEDNIITDSRQDLRTLRQLAQTYTLQQRAVELAYAQVDNATSTFVAPPDPAARESAGNVAALTQQLLDAQSTLLTAQNDLYTTWITYQTTRLELYLDLELLPLDARGLFADEAAPRQPVDAPGPNGGPGPGPARPDRDDGPAVPAVPDPAGRSAPAPPRRAGDGTGT